ncbi:MAG: hypothetical protein A2W00_05930 [Candidatus Eisenbacteria bacterium RBG_16_71_46]|nr:MAG: hypothetical protein A2W00_05930 [Candidatus Eisenbacteria bacterium RBG_16_71_46]
MRIAPNATLTATLCAAVLLLSVPPARAASTAFSDGVFVNSDWTLVIEGLNGGGTASGFQSLTGGNPVEYRRVNNTTNSAIGTGVSNTVFGAHFRSGAVFNPGVGGALLSVDFSAATIRVAGGVQAYGLALRQGGVIYYGPGFLNPTAFGTWTTTTQTGLVAANFDAAAPGVQTPDFGVTGGPIEFGFSSANSTSVGGGGGTTQGGIDNWSVTLQYDRATAVDAVSWGRLKHLYWR